MARKIIQQIQAPVSSPLTIGGFFTPAKISQSGGLLRVSANAETTRAAGLKDLYLPLEILAGHFGGIPAGMSITVQVEAADGAQTLPVGGIEQAQRRGADGRRVGYDTGAHASLVPPGLVRDQWVLDGDGRRGGGRITPTRQPAPTTPTTPTTPTAPSGPTAPSEASSLAVRVGALEQGIAAILDALAASKK